MSAIWTILMAIMLMAACAGEGSTDVPGGAGGKVTPEPTATPTADNDKTVSSSDPLPTPEPTKAVPADMVEVPAPIESVEIIIAESFPPQYFAHVIYGMPNGCVEFYGYEESRSGNAIAITVTNLEPAPTAQVACAAVYLTGEVSVPLGSDFQKGDSYTVEVNGVIETFVAQ